MRAVSAARPRSEQNTATISSSALRSPSSLAWRWPSGESCPSSQPEATQRSLSVVVECVSKTISIVDARLRRAMGLVRVLEPEEADGARPGVRADDGSQGRRELDLRLRPHAPGELGERADPLLRVGVGDRDAQAGAVGGRLHETPLELDERLLLATHAG